jgi:GTPase
LYGGAGEGGAGDGEGEMEMETVGRRLDEGQMKDAVTRLKGACDGLKVTVEELYSVVGGRGERDPSSSSSSSSYSAHLLRLTPAGPSSIMEVRICVVGNVDAGKSTMLGVLTRGGLDDGRGKARVALFRHKHEIETGRTSSVGMEVSVARLAGGVGPGGRR